MLADQEQRMYNQWGGNPQGTPEDPERCIAEVLDWAGWHIVSLPVQHDRVRDATSLYQHGWQRRVPRL